MSTPRPRNPFTRALSATFTAALVLLLSDSGQLHGQELGGNFNENIHNPIQHIDQLKDSRVNWVRGFVNIPRFFLGTDGDRKISGVREDAIDTFDDIRKFLNAKRASGGRINLILSLKIPFEEFSHKVPEPGTQEMGYLLEAIEKFLLSRDVGKNIEILVMGNEPMWENGGEAADYGVFLNLLADRLAVWKVEHEWDFMVFAGALNRIWELPNHDTVPVVINAAKENPNIDGLDLHIHAVNSVQAGNDLKTARETFNFTKKLICTEFSMVRALDPRVDNEIGSWGAQYGYPTNMKMYEWLNHISAEAAGGNPVSEEEFLGFFHSRPWYPQHWYGSLYDDFETYDTYAITGRFVTTVGARNYGSNAAMWDLGAIYSGAFMGRDPDTGLLNASPLLYPEFKLIADSLYGEGPIDPVLNVASLNGALNVDWAAAPADGGWGASTSRSDGFAITSLINGVEAGALSYATNDDITLGVGGVGGFGFTRTVNTNLDSSIIEGIRIDLPVLGGRVGPEMDMEFYGLTGMQFGSMTGGASASNAIAIHGFLADPDAAFIMGGGELSFDADAGTLTIEAPTEETGILEFSNPNATLSPAGVSLTLTNLTAKANGHGFGLAQWRYAVVPGDAVFGFLEEPQDATVRAGTEVIFSCEIVNGSDLVAAAFQWEESVDGGESWARIDGAEASSYIVESADIAWSDRQYRVVVSRDRDRLTSAAAVLWVSGTPETTLLEDWRQENFGTISDEGDAANTADFDGDGFQNLLEYALGTDPKNPGDARTAVSLDPDEDFLTLAFDHIDDPSLTYAVEAADQLDGEWNLSEAYSFNSAGTRVHEEPIPLNGANRQFLRMRVMLIE